MIGIEKLYHYTSDDVCLNYILKSDSVRFGHLQNTNDPRENIEHLPDFDLNLFKGLQFSFTGYSEISKEFVPFLSRRKQKISLRSGKYKIFCCTQDKAKIETVFDYGFCKPRMWAQYGKDHKGCCIVFNKSILDSCISDQDIVSDPVSYDLSEQNKNGKIVLNNIESLKIINMAIEEYSQKIFIKSLFKKSSDWKEENEFRYIKYSPSKEYFYCDVGNAIVAIVISYRFSQSQLPLLLEKCSHRNIPVYRMNWVNGVPYWENLHLTTAST